MDLDSLAKTTSRSYDRSIEELARTILHLTALDHDEDNVQRNAPPQDPPTSSPNKQAAAANEDFPANFGEAQRTKPAISSGKGQLAFFDVRSSTFVGLVMERVADLEEANMEAVKSAANENPPPPCSESTTCLHLHDDEVRPRSSHHNGTLSKSASSSPPGAFAVTPGSTELVAEGDDNPRAFSASNSQHSSDTPSTASSSNFSAGINISTENNNESSTTLEAVRVDDITVKAEPVPQDRGRGLLQMILASAACSFLILVVILTTTMRRPSNTPSSTEELVAPTYDPDTRLALLRELVLEGLRPLYNTSYNDGKADNNPFINATQLLEDVLNDSQTPQYQALQWLALEDNLVAGIPQPNLEFTATTTSESTKDHQTGSLRHNPTRQLQQSNPADQPQPIIIGKYQILQRYALAVLYYSTSISNVSQWTEHFEFLEEEPECDWSGAILCNDENFVTHLDLQQNNLVGTVPIELGLLTTLEFLSLKSNAMHGTLPPALSQLTHLKSLDLGFNDMSGTVPVSLFQNWKDNIESWAMNDNRFSGTLPSAFGDLVHLKSVLWQENDFQGSLPTSIWTNLTSLQEFNFARQKGLSIPTVGSEIGLWSNLVLLEGNAMDIHGTLPTQIGLLTQMTHLQLKDNHISGTVPSELFCLTKLEFVHLGMNGFTGTVPTEILHLTNLDQLYFQNTRLTGDVGFVCNAVEDGTMKHINPLRFDMREVANCSCCTCCKY